MGESQRVPETVTGRSWEGNWVQDPTAGRERCSLPLSIFVSFHLYHRLSSSLSLCASLFPGGASGKEPTCQCRRCKRHRFDPWVGKIPWRRVMATHSSILAWKISWTAEPGGLRFMGSQRIKPKQLSIAHSLLFSLPFPGSPSPWI